MKGTMRQATRLFNFSEYSWTVVSANRKESHIKFGQDFTLGPEKQSITFTKGVSGTITPVIPDPVAPAPEKPATQLPENE